MFWKKRKDKVRAFWHNKNVVTIFKDGRPILTLTGKFSEKAKDLPRISRRSIHRMEKRLYA